MTTQLSKLMARVAALRWKRMTKAERRAKLAKARAAAIAANVLRRTDPTAKPRKNAKVKVS